MSELLPVKTLQERLGTLPFQHWWHVWHLQEGTLSHLLYPQDWVGDTKEMTGHWR